MRQRYDPNSRCGRTAHGSSWVSIRAGALSCHGFTVVHLVLQMNKMGYNFGLFLSTASTKCLVRSLIALEAMVGVVRVLHTCTGNMVKSRWCWHVPVAVVVPIGAACVDVKKPRRNHNVSGLANVQCGHMFAHGNQSWCLDVMQH